MIGLVGTADSRLNTITLVGDSGLISVAESFLKQIDLRKRQVAVKVQILNVDLTNAKSINASFSAKLGNSFLVSESGRAFMNFGDSKPGGRSGAGIYKGGEFLAPGVYEQGKQEGANAVRYPSNSLYGYLEAVIDSSSAKTLAQPTLWCRRDRRLRFRLAQV